MRKKHAFIVNQQFCKSAPLPANERQIPHASRLIPAIDMTAGKTAQVSITSNLEASQLVQTYPQLAIVPVDKPRSPADLAFITPQTDQVWINFLNHWITIKTNQGFFLELQDRWMPQP